MRPNTILLILAMSFFCAHLFAEDNERPSRDELIIQMLNGESLFKDPRSDDQIVQKIDANERVKIIGELNGKSKTWYKVETQNGMVGFVPQQSVAFHRPEHSFLLPQNTRAINELGLNLIRKVPSGNAVVSPYGIWANLRVLLAGAEGETRSELYRLLGRNVKSPSVFLSKQFNTADAILIRNDLEITDYFGSFASGNSIQILRTDFTSDNLARCNQEVRNANKWLKTDMFGGAYEQSGQPIQAVVVNVSQFKGEWMETFSTLDGAFLTGEGEGVVTTVPMMRSAYPYHFYGADSSFDCGILPYRDSDIVAAVIVPKPKVTLQAMLAEFNSEKLEYLLRSTSESRRIVMPRFRMNFSVNVLEHLPLPESTSFERANFKRLSGSQLAIGGVSQISYLSVDEKGTEAGAKTETNVLSDGSDTLVANRPFLFAIVHAPTATTLFLSTVVNPASAQDSIP